MRAILITCRSSTPIKSAGVTWAFAQSMFNETRPKVVSAIENSNTPSMAENTPPFQVKPLLPLGAGILHAFRRRIGQIYGKLPRGQNCGRTTRTPATVAGLQLIVIANILRGKCGGIQITERRDVTGNQGICPVSTRRPIEIVARRSRRCAPSDQNLAFALHLCTRCRRCPWRNLVARRRKRQENRRQAP